MIKEIEPYKKINKNTCQFCQFYETDVMPTEQGDIKLEWCHNFDNKYKMSSKKQILSFKINECNGFKEKVKYYLKKIEQEYNITILYAIESGSRAWGFANDESDYDIRFIYTYNDIHEYLHINNDYEDVMIFNDGIYDIVGWDIKKTLYLHSKNNPSLYEWLNATHIYIEDFNQIFRDLPEFNTKSLLHHYLNMGKNHYKKYCKNYIDTLDLILTSKKFLYTIRSILNWNIIYSTNEKPLINFHQLIGQNIKHGFLTEKIHKQIDNLNQLYDTFSKEEGLISYHNHEFFSIFKELEKWIVESLNYMEENTNKYKSPPREHNSYDEVFHKVLGV